MMAKISKKYTYSKGNNIRKIGTGTIFTNRWSSQWREARLNIQNRDFVRTAVLQKIDAKKLKNDFVWDLTVEDEPEFFANGILVHNCIDGIRYVFMAKNQMRVPTKAR